MIEGEGGENDEKEDANENSAASATKNDTSRRGKTTEFKKCELGNEYKTVRAAQKASSSERLLNPSSTSTELVSTLAFDEEDERIMHCVKVHDTRDRQCPSTLPPNNVLSAFPLLIRPSGPVMTALEVLVGSDQCFPACLPVVSRKECIRAVFLNLPMHWGMQSALFH